MYWDWEFDSHQLSRLVCIDLMRSTTLWTYALASIMLPNSILVNYETLKKICWKQSEKTCLDKGRLWCVLFTIAILSCLSWSMDKYEVIQWICFDLFTMMIYHSLHNISVLLLDKTESKVWRKNICIQSKNLSISQEK